MRLQLALGLVGMLAAAPAAAQTVMRPAPALDSTQTALRDALVLLRDSLATIDGAAARLQRDYQAASDQALLSRARVMQAACARSVKTVPPTRSAVQSARLTGDQKLKHRRQLVNALDSLKQVLVYCESEFAGMSRPGQGEHVRGSGNDRAGRVQVGLRRYEHTLAGFLQVMKIRIPPLGMNNPQASR